MTTLRERLFEQCFCTEKSLEQASFTCKYDKEEVLAFFRQELLALAEQVERTREYPNDNIAHSEFCAKIDPKYRECAKCLLEKAASLIRAKANELSDPNQLI